MEGIIGEIRMFAGNFAPRDWAFCQGQILPIASNTALFSILGTTYGGNGSTTFALPDLRGRVPVGQGQGPGLPGTQLGQMAGEPNHTLIITEMPAHNHPTQVQVNVQSSPGTSRDPVNNYLAATSAGNSYDPGSDGGKMNANATQVSLGIAGGSQAHNNMQPYLGMNYIICMNGIYPSRN